MLDSLIFTFIMGLTTGYILRKEKKKKKKSVYEVLPQRQGVQEGGGNMGIQVINKENKFFHDIGMFK